MSIKKINASGGKFNIVTLFLLLIAAGLLFAGIFILPKFLANFNLSQEMWKYMVRATELTDDQIKAKTMEIAKAQNIPLEFTDLECMRQGSNINCHFDYYWPVVVKGKELFKLHFRVNKNRPITKIKF